MLIYTGKHDANIVWDHTMEFYIALQRNKKEAVALFYPEDGHYMYTVSSAKDLNFRILDWLGYFLKDKKDVSWINKQMKPTE